MSKLIFMLTMASAPFLAACADSNLHQPLPSVASPPAGFRGPGTAYGGHSPMSFGQQMPGAPKQAHFPHGQQQPMGLRAVLMDRLQGAKHKPLVARTLNSMKPLVGGAARFAAPAINKATAWSKQHGHHHMMQSAPHGANSFAQASLKPQAYGGIPSVSHHRGGPISY